MSKKCDAYTKYSDKLKSSREDSASTTRRAGRTLRKQQILLCAPAHKKSRQGLL